MKNLVSIVGFAAFFAAIWILHCPLNVHACPQKPASVDENSAGKEKEFVVRIAEIEETPHMIKSLELVPMHPLDPGHADGIFKKWSAK